MSIGLFWAFVKLLSLNGEIANDFVTVNSFTVFSIPAAVEKK